MQVSLLRNEFSKHPSISQFFNAHTIVGTNAILFPCCFCRRLQLLISEVELKMRMLSAPSTSLLLPSIMLTGDVDIRKNVAECCLLSHFFS
jgi:hypothetical protein